MPMIRFLSRRARNIEVVHPTAPRVGIFVKAQRARSTGPQAHLNTYIADEERLVRGQVIVALGRLTLILCVVALGLQIFGFVEHLAISLGWIVL